MTLGERLSDTATRRKKRGGFVVLLVVMAGAAGVSWVVWQHGGDEARVPTKEQLTRPAGAQYLVTSQHVRTSQGFEVVTLTDEDLAAEPRLRDLVDGAGRSSVILAGADHERLRAHLAAKLPPGWDDPFAYGVAWRHGNTVVQLTSGQADVL